MSARIGSVCTGQRFYNISGLFPGLGPGQSVAQKLLKILPFGHHPLFIVVLPGMRFGGKLVMAPNFTVREDTNVVLKAKTIRKPQAGDFPGVFPGQSIVAKAVLDQVFNNCVDIVLRRNGPEEKPLPALAVKELAEVDKS